MGFCVKNFSAQTGLTCWLYKLIPKPFFFLWYPYLDTFPWRKKISHKRIDRYQGSGISSFSWGCLQGCKKKKIFFFFFFGFLRPHKRFHNFMKFGSCWPKFLNLKKFWFSKELARLNLYCTLNKLFFHVFVQKFYLVRSWKMRF
jgi:hypothetical protein